MDGYNRAAPVYNLPTMGDFEFQFLNGNQDFLTYSLALSMEEWLSFKSVEEFKKAFEIRSKSRCSAIVKVTPLLDDVFIAHSTWSEYFWMNRVFKHYLLKLKMPIPTTHMAFSSYPASLSSIDDWYVMDSGLAVVETTNDIFNKSLFSRLTPETLLSWQRVRIANALATTAQEWTQIFAEYNSGTYNNQWIALQFSAFKPNQPLPDGLVWIAEQIPGNVSFMDVTSEVERGYWGSYVNQCFLFFNVPAIEYIYKISGNEAIAKAFGPSLSYDLAPRARIFRRDANNCNNVTTLGKFMRYNNYLNDPIENNDPSWAIMSRYDLSKDPSAFGGVDTKMSNLEMMQNVYGLAQAGPTHDDLPPFVWTAEFDKFNDHIACPIKYDFDWIEMKSALQD
ncbi:hypothetical protein RFI_23087 [Reticulomyxa filosa]|uniref:Phospholipase B-like n=1 Tax=Reticulomyxa filosa TaxID=46433 RepID=X6MJU5_RETFI|nr:hypothetical protein RFI_23087 [Reticulomyxa filosa]|eukprot:ETO14283.1 hypothetical protein RFI_23087 [Reticulomyxa filosa]